MRISATALVIALILALAGCVSGNTQLTEGDNGKTVRLTVDETLTIKLPGNPSTGYSWNGAADPEVVVLVREPEFKSDATDENIVGAGGTLTMTYKAVKAGEGELKLQYSRVWESVQPEKTFTVKVVVGE